MAPQSPLAFAPEHLYLKESPSFVPADVQLWTELCCRGISPSFHMPCGCIPLPAVALKGSNKITDKFQELILCESTFPSMIALEGLGDNAITGCWTLAAQVHGQMLHPVKASANWER